MSHGRRKIYTDATEIIAANIMKKGHAAYFAQLCYSCEKD